MQLELNADTVDVLTANPGLDLDLFREQFCTLLGMPESIPVSLVVQQLIGGLVSPTPENQEKINYLLAFVATQKPASLLEAQLLLQMFSSHHLATEMLKKASEERWPENIEKYVNIAMKLSRGYKGGLESLARYRRDGRQYMFIEHVHVGKDANAVIGNVQRGVG